MPLIIITDDEPMNIRMTEFVLRKYGYSTVSAGSGEKCVVLAEKGADLILMDVLMPGMDGLQTYEKLRSCGIDPDVYTGFAFGIGIDRITTTRYKISDIRLLFENDKRFLEQF